MFQKLRDSLTKVDIFGQSINFTFRQEEQYKTSLGGFTSICILAIILSFFYSNIIDFFAMTSVSSNTEFYFENDPSLIRLTKENYMFAVQIDQTNFTRNPFFNISVEQRHYKRFENGTQIKLPATYLDMVQCTPEHFRLNFEKHGINFTEEFVQKGLSNFLCPDLKTAPNYNFSELLVGGVYSSAEYYFLKFSVTTCIDNGKNNFTWKPTCKTEDEIQAALESWGSFRFQLITTNYIVNPNKPNKYVQPYLAIDQFYTFIPNSMFVQSDIFLRTKDIRTNKGILMYPDENVEKLAFREHGDSRYQFEINKLKPGYYAAFYLDRSPYSYQINRKFLTLDQLLSYLGGFVQFMIVVFGVVVQFYNRQHLIIALANDLYEFSKKGDNSKTKSYLTSLMCKTLPGKQLISLNEKKVDSKNQIQTLTPFNSKPIMKQNIQPKKSSQAIEIKIPRPSVQEQANEYFEKFRIFIKSKFQIGLSFRIVMSVILPFEKFMNDECYLISKAVEQVRKEIDISFVLNKLHEISKLKTVLFSDEQESLFNFSHKPIISLITENKRRSTKLVSQITTINQSEIGVFKQFQDLVTSYHKLIIASSENMTMEQLRFNQRLIILLGKELISILDAEIQDCMEQDESQEPLPEEDQVFSER